MKRRRDESSEAFRRRKRCRVEVYQLNPEQPPGSPAFAELPPTEQKLVAYFWDEAVRQHTSAESFDALIAEGLAAVPGASYEDARVAAIHFLSEVQVRIGA